GRISSATAACSRRGPRTRCWPTPTCAACTWANPSAFEARRRHGAGACPPHTTDAMKPRLQTAIGQHLVLTPQLRQALHLLQLSAVELEAEVAAALESNPLLDWADDADRDGEPGPDAPEAPSAEAAGLDWERDADAWAGRGPDPEGPDDPTERLAGTETLHDHLRWQLQLSHLSPRDLEIGLALVDAIDDDGYLRESPDAIAAALRPDI